MKKISGYYYGSKIDGKVEFIENIQYSLKKRVDNG